MAFTAFSFGADAGSVNVSGTSDVVTCNITVSGATGAGCVVQSPAPKEYYGCFDVAPSGNDYSCEVTLPADIKGGTYSVRHIFASNGTGTLRMTGNELVNEFAATTAFTVTSTSADSTPMEAVLFSASPTAIDPDVGGMVSCGIGIDPSDTGTPFRDFTCIWQDPSGRTKDPTTKQSYGCASSTYDCSFTIPAGVEAGYWTINSVTIHDVAGNVAVLDIADIGAINGTTVLDLSGGGGTGECALSADIVASSNNWTDSNTDGLGNTTVPMSDGWITSFVQTNGDDSIYALGSGAINSPDDAAMLVRFDGTTGYIQALNGNTWENRDNLTFTTGATHWYAITTYVDWINSKYSVIARRCDSIGNAYFIVEDADFQTGTNTDGGISHYAVFAPSGVTAAVADTAWLLYPDMPDCVDDTCGGVECGQPADGCGGILASCGTCTLYANSFCDGTYQCDCAPNDQTWCTSQGYECGMHDDGCNSTVACGAFAGGCDTGEACSGAPGYTCEPTGGEPTIFWESTEQTTSNPFGFDYGAEANGIGCNYPIQPGPEVTETCADNDSDGIAMERVTTDPGLYAIRSFGNFNCGAGCPDPKGARASGLVWGSTARPDLQAAYTNQDPIWISWEAYFPVAIDGTGWFLLMDIHGTTSQFGGGSRLAPNPGLYFFDDGAGGDPTNGYLPGDMGVGFYWPALPGDPSSTRYAGLPVAQWFEMEMMYQRSSGGGATDGAAQLWINNTLVIDQQNIETWLSGYNYVEIYPGKLYGVPGGNDWSLGDVRFYTRNLKISDQKLSDGNAGDATAPTTEPYPGTGGTGGAGGTGGDPGTCDDLKIADYTYVSGFGTSVAETPGTNTVTADFWVRPSTQAVDALIGMGEVPITTFGLFATEVIFGADNAIKALHGSTSSIGCFDESYTPITCPTYVAGNWYRIVITADLVAQTYTVQVGECSDALTTIATDIDFRDDTGSETFASLGYWNGWASSSNALYVADMTWTPTNLSTGDIVVDALTGLPPSCTGGISWSITGASSHSGTGSTTLVDVPVGNYTIDWLDSSLPCTPPVDDGPVTLNADQTITFDLSPNNYTTRSTFSSVNTDVGLDGNYSSAPPGGGAWTMESNSHAAQFAASGTGDVTGVTPSQGDFYVGRTYTLDWTPESGYTDPADNTITTSGSYQGNYVPISGADLDFYATRTTCMAPCGVVFEAQSIEALSWATVRDSEFVWDYGDGTTSDGFMGAHVYEPANQYDGLDSVYTVTLTVDGVQWNQQQITVQDPTTVRCVSSPTDPQNCGISGATQYTSAQAATALTTIPSRSHVLFQRGGAYGSHNLAGKSNVAIGAYGTGTNCNPRCTNAPAFSGNTDTWDLGSQQVIMDLSITKTVTSGGGMYQGTDSLTLRTDLNVTGTSSNGTGFSADEFVIKDSKVHGGAYAAIFSTSDRYALLGTEWTADGTPSETTIRTSNTTFAYWNGNRVVSGIFKGDCSTRQVSLWHLIQDNYFYEACMPSTDTAETQRAYHIWERNFWEGRTSEGSGYDYQVWVQLRDSVFRNNIFVDVGHAAGGQAIDVHGNGVTPSNMLFVNNTCMFLESGASRRCLQCSSGCEARNNLQYNAPGIPLDGSNPFVPNTSDNWAYTNGTCSLDPGGAGSCDPQFLSVDYDSPDVGRPAASTKGIDNGYNTVPVWEDFHNADRDDGNIDIGAVER